MLLLAALVLLQNADARIIGGGEILRHGGYLDLDAQVASSHAEGGDLRFLADGNKGWIEPVNGTLYHVIEKGNIYAMAEGVGAITESAKLEVARGAAVTLLVFTSSRRRALCHFEFPIDEDAHVLGVTYRYRTAEGTAFPLPPHDAEVDQVEAGLRLRWKGESAEYGVWVAGSLAATVSANEHVLPKLKPNEPVRIRVARKIAANEWSEALEFAAASGTPGVICGVCEVTDYRANGSFSFLDKKSGPPDLSFFRRGVAATSPGGLIFIGHGEKLYHDLKRAPSRGYFPEIDDRIQQGDVFAVRLPDGRYAKLIYTRDQWYAHMFQWELLSQGGTVFPVGPEITRLSLESGALTLKIDGPALPAGEARYRIYRSGARGLELLGETRGTTFTDKTAKPRTLQSYAVTFKSATGQETAPRYLDTDTLPTWWRRGRFTLGTQGNGWSFADGANSSGKGDIYISGSAGGASSVTLACAGGCGRTDGPFGDLGDFDFEKTKGILKVEELQTDDRQPETETFWVAAANGDLVQVHIASRTFPNVTFEYILVPLEHPLETCLAALKAAAVAPTKEEGAHIAELLKNFDADDIEAREKASTGIVEFGMKAASALLEWREKWTSPELRSRIHRAIRMIHDARK